MSYQTITTKYVGPSNTKPARISATNHNGARVIISRHTCDDVQDSHAAAVKALCAKLQWDKMEFLGGYIDGDTMIWINAKSTDRVAI